MLTAHGAPSQCPEQYGEQAYAHPQDCDHFFLCTNGTLTLETCENGLLFDGKGGVHNHCNYNWAVDCGERQHDRKNFKSTSLHNSWLDWIFSNSNFHSGLRISVRHLRRSQRMLDQLHQVRVWRAAFTSMHQGISLRSQDPRMQLAWYVVRPLQSRSRCRIQVPIEGRSAFTSCSLLAIPTLRRSQRSTQFVLVQWRSSAFDSMWRREVFRSEHFDLWGCRISHQLLLLLSFSSVNNFSKTWNFPLTTFLMNKKNHLWEFSWND